jgi:hypothetical protein
MNFETKDMIVKSLAIISLLTLGSAFVAGFGFQNFQLFGQLLAAFLLLCCIYMSTIIWFL